jgi:hypothetical protein
MTEPDDQIGEDEWAASLLFGPEPSAAPQPERNDDEDLGHHDDDDGGDDDDDGSVPASAEPDAPPTPTISVGPAEPIDANAGAKKTAVVLGAGLLVAVIAIVATLTVFGRPNEPAVADTAPSVPARPSIAPTQSAPPPTDSDQSVPFTASARCPAGSTSAQALTDTAGDSAWVCVRGAPGGQVDGQVLHIDLGRSHLLTAVSVTPGWVAKTPGGKDEWLAHRVVTRLQYIFNDDDRTILTQDTGNAHGPVTTPLPHRVLASRVTVVILQTSRPPASPLPNPAQAVAAQPGFLDSVLGAANGPAPSDATQTSAPAADSAEQLTGDPVDFTFAIAAMKFFGHQPD